MKGVISTGIECPIIREGDDLIKIVVDSVLDSVKKNNGWFNFSDSKYDINDKDVIGITESVIARSAGLYVSVDEIAEDIIKKFGKKKTIVVANPIYSRNRFAMILKGIARAAKKIILYMPDYDEVGNPSGVNPFTGVDIKEYYKELIEGENCECVIHEWGLGSEANTVYQDLYPLIYCGLHDYGKWGSTGDFITLADICKDKNPDFGVLGTNKATEERLKLFPTKAEAKRVCEGVKKGIKGKTGKDVIVMSYGDGCYKDLDAGIWECADPVCSPGYTDEELLNSTPNELKIKALADDKYKDLTGDDLLKAIKGDIVRKDTNLKGKMSSQGTTPRRYINLLASLMDLTSGSGDRCTPVVLVRNYFKKN